MGCCASSFVIMLLQRLHPTSSQKSADCLIHAVVLQVICLGSICASSLLCLSSLQQRPQSV